MSDGYQIHNGQRWCWCSAKQAAWAFGRYPVRLVGPDSTDAPVRHEYAMRRGPDGTVNQLVWIGDMTAVEQELARSEA